MASVRIMGRSPWTASTFALLSSRKPVITAIQFPYQYQCTYLSTDTRDKENETKAPNPSLIKAYLDLSKARLSSLVVVTTAAGFLAAGGPLTTMTAACAGTMLCSSSAAAFNQIIEVDRDSQMKRTQQRPMVQGTLSPTHATLVATAWGVAGTGILAVGTDPYTTALGATNILLYAGLYTYMKPRTVWNTWVGAGTFFFI
jgi:heme o synthase